MSNYALVLDKNKQPLSPCHPSVARKLLDSGKAAVFRMYPFTIILNKSCSDVVNQAIELKIDPGSKTTGIALVQGEKIIFGAELSHRGSAIKASLESRRSLRSGRRNRHTRYRQARFLNRTRTKNWLAPSLQHRVETTLTWVKKLIKFAPITRISQELVRFDLQQIDNPEISGIEYQQGTLSGYEVREYLLEKWQRKCAYCGIENVPLQVEHIHPKAIGELEILTNKPLLIKATGHGTRQMCRTDKFGFPSRYVPRIKFVKGFQTGDIVKAIVTTGNKIGKYIGRVAVRATGSFNISASKLVQGISYKYCKIIHRKDGYDYAF
ncbi:MAG: RRXRR domain-containing protein [Dolichospermum sp. WA123]|nr:RRXRR domain-containing protein [Dolichospermum sp. WA123]